MKSSDRFVIVCIVLLMLVVCVGGGFVIRQFHINETASDVEAKTEEAVAEVTAITVIDGKVYVPEGVTLEGADPELLELIIASNSETANIIAELGAHDVDAVVELGVNTQWSGAVSDVSRAVMFLSMLGLAVIGIVAGIYFSKGGGEG